MKKILIVIPNVAKAGGTERAGINMANIFSKNYDVKILSLARNNNKPFYAINDNVKIIYSQIGDIPVPISKKIKWFYKVYSFIKKQLYDVDIIIGLGHNINAAIGLLKTPNKIIIGCEHIDYNSIPKMSKLIMNRVYPKLDALVVLSKIAQENVKHLNKKVVIIPNSLPFETNKYSELDNNRILMVGRLSPEKGYERIIPLGKYLKNNYPGWKIDIFGDGNIYDELKSLYQDHNLHNIFLNRAVQNIKEEYLKSSLLLSTSYNEAMPMVFLEAMSCGVPVLSYRNEGAECIVEESRNGVIVDTEEELIKECSKLIDDAVWRKMLGRNGVESSKEFSADNVRFKWYTLLNSFN